MGSNGKAGGMSEYFKPQYDSDDDLNDDERKKIKDAPVAQQDTVRQAQWDNEGAFPKLKSSLKGMYYGDKRSK